MTLHGACPHVTCARPDVVVVCTPLSLPLSEMRSSNHRCTYFLLVPLEDASRFSGGEETWNRSSQSEEPATHTSHGRRIRARHTAEYPPQSQGSVYLRCGCSVRQEGRAAAASLEAWHRCPSPSRSSRGRGQLSYLVAQEGNRVDNVTLAS